MNLKLTNENSTDKILQTGSKTDSQGKIRENRTDFVQVVWMVGWIFYTCHVGLMECKTNKILILIRWRQIKK